MAASRKLQGEIDRCLKKVGEGVEQFEDIWKKVYNATNSNQKEKYEADLKKEIKKLQRLRDQIKSWLTSAEIKDKSQLLENRKLIETQMERFKVVERETKTKAYSKEGLGAAQNKDPAQKDRDETNRWLSDSIDTLNIQIDQFESEIESLMAAGKKRKIDKEKSERIEELRKWVEKHRFHIKKLEILMRMLNNESIDCDMIKKIKEDIEYYLEFCQDSDFVENDSIYDDIDLEDLDYSAPEITVGKVSKNLAGSHDSTEGSTPSSSVCGTSPAPSPAMPNNHSNDHNEVQSQGTPSNNTTHHEKRRTTKAEDSRSSRVNAQGSTPVKPQVVRPINSTSSMNALTNHSNKSTPVPATPTKPVSGSTSQSTPNNSSSSSGLVNHLNSPSQLNRVDSSHASNSVSHNSTNSHSSLATLAAAISGNSNSHANSNGPSITLPTIGSSNINVNSNSNIPPIIGPSSQGFSTVPSTVHSSSTNSLATQSTKANVGLSEQSVSLKAMAAKKLDEVSLAQHHVASGISTTSLTSSSSNLSGCATSISTNSSGISLTQTTSLLTTASTTTVAVVCKPHDEITISPLLGVAPLGSVRLNQEHKLQFDRLQAAFYHMPHPSDSERFRLHFPRQPCQTPEYYPQVPPHLSDTVEFFQRLSTETLFFIFYYMEGTKAQYLAAKALKKQSWRFHTKYMMWFQRHEEPKAITDEFEQGTYIFFDCENWGQRKRENFIFEYKYLEDRDLN